MQDRKLLAKRNEGDMTATETAKSALQICTTNLKSNIKNQQLRRNYYQLEKIFIHNSQIYAYLKYCALQIKAFSQ